MQNHTFHFTFERRGDYNGWLFLTSHRNHNFFLFSILCYYKFIPPLCGFEFMCKIVKIFKKFSLSASNKKKIFDN